MNLSSPSETARRSGKEIASPEEIGSPRLRELQLYWSTLRRTRQGMHEPMHPATPQSLPSRRDIDPLEVPTALLPHLSLLDVEGGSGRLRYRLVGTHIVAQYGSDPTGRFLEETKEPFHAPLSLNELGKTVARSGRARRLEGWLSGPAGEFLAFECLALPLAADGRNVDMILCGLHADEDTRLTAAVGRVLSL